MTDAENPLICVLLGDKLGSCKKDIMIGMIRATYIARKQILIHLIKKYMPKNNIIYWYFVQNCQERDRQVKLLKKDSQIIYSL